MLLQCEWRACALGMGASDVSSVFSPPTDINSPPRGERVVVPPSTPSRLTKPHRISRKSLRNIWSLLCITWKTSHCLFLASTLTRVLRGIPALAKLWIAKLIIDVLIRSGLHAHRVSHTLWLLLASEFLIAGCGDLLVRGGTLSESILGDRVAADLSVRVMQHASSLDLEMFESAAFQDNLERVRSQTSGRVSVLNGVLSAGEDIITVAALAVSIMAIKPWLLLLLFVAAVPGFLGETQVSVAQYSTLFHSTPLRRRLDYLRSICSNVQMFKEVKLYQLGDYLTTRYRALWTSIENENRLLSYRSAGILAAANAVSLLTYYVGYAVVLRATALGMMSVGTLTYVCGALWRVRTSIQHLCGTVTDIAEHAINLDSIFAFLAVGSEIDQLGKPTMCWTDSHIQLECDHVSFHYAGCEQQPALKNVTFRATAGQIIALVGENGSGKSTLMKLLTGLYRPSNGRITINGRDIHDVDLSSVRTYISAVFQDFNRYDFSARENIGCSNVSTMSEDERLQRAASKSGAGSVISRLPRGLDQIIGRRFESGVDLSGGEWQRIAIARAYFRHAKLIVLDEPTAQLDARAEEDVFQVLRADRSGRVAVIVSHRLATVRRADLILVLSHGEVVERGTHEELLSKKGKYYELFTLQAAGYR